MSCLLTKPTKCPVWSESLLSAWRKLGSIATYWVHSEDSDQAELSLCWAHSHFVDFVMRGLILRENEQFSANCKCNNWLIEHWLSMSGSVFLLKKTRLLQFVLKFIVITLLGVVGWSRGAGQLSVPGGILYLRLLLTEQGPFVLATRIGCVGFISVLSEQ